MRIWEYVGSSVEAVKRHAPDATPLKNACINSCTAALTKIAVPVKSACRNSYDCGSAAFSKVDRTVRTVRLRRWPAGGETSGAYERIPSEDVEEVEEPEGLIPTPVKTNACSDGGAAKSVSYSYVFLTFAKIGYIVRVKVVCRIVQRISDDGTKSSVRIYATDIAHESDDALGDREYDTVENEPKNSFGTRTFAKMVDDIKKLMSDPVIKSRIIIYTSMLMDNVRFYGLQHGLAPDGVTVSIILTKTLVDILIDVVIEMADSREQLTGLAEMDGKWYSSMFDFLKGKVGIVALTNFLIFTLKEFSAFSRTEPFRTKFHSKRMLTKEYLVLMMRKFLEFVKKRHCSAGFFIVLEIVMAVMRSLMSTHFVNEWLFHGSATRGEKRNYNNSNSKKKAAVYEYC